MAIDRRSLIALSALGSAVPIGTLATPVAASTLSTLGVDATRLGVRAGGGADQTAMLQSAIDQTAGARVPLVLGPGDYRTGELKLSTGAQIIGVRGATRLVFTGGGALISARGADHVTLSGLVLDGAALALPDTSALVRLAQGRNVRIQDCELVNAGGHGLLLEAIDGVLSGSTIAMSAAVAIVSREARGLLIQGNAVRSAAGGILIERASKDRDGTLVIDNNIEDIAAARGGEPGHAIDIIRAGGVVVRGNRIHRVAGAAVRGRAVCNLQVSGNTATEIGATAIEAEFGFEGAVIANNTIDGAAHGVVVTAFSEGGRLAVVQGNLIRNLRGTRHGGTDSNAGVGISVEADAAVTGNVIENATAAGIGVGRGAAMRDVSVVGNVVRGAHFGIAISVANGAGTAVVAGNLIAGSSRGAIVGVDVAQAVTGDLVKEPKRYANLQISGNRVR